MTSARTPRLLTTPTATPSSCTCGAAVGDTATADTTTCTALLIAVLCQISTAATDARTGLLTHDAWQHVARRAVAEHDSCALLIIDLDHVKRVNDTHGHLVGDRLIAAVADQIRHSAGEHGTAGRFGGDEFLILLPTTDHADALHRAEDLRRRVAALTIATGNPNRPVVWTTVSIGLTLTTPDGDLIDALWRADAALYAAKAAGRDTVRSSHPSTGAV